MKYLLILLPCFLYGQVAKDTIYNNQIKSIQLSGSFSAQYGAVLGPAVSTLGQPLGVSFDDLSAAYHTYNYTIKHFNADWTPSALNLVEYWADFKEMPIENYQNSQRTKVAYMHYEVSVPSPKKSGNYTISVFNSGKMVFSRRFSILDAKLTIQSLARFSQDPLNRRSHQQLAIDINYGSYSMQNPAQELKVVVRKNYRWAGSITGIKPIQVSEASQTLSYANVSEPLEFYAGNEYRYFDARSTFQKGFFIDRIQKGNVDDVWIESQKSRARGPYLEMIDRNGLWAVGTRDADDANTQADYPFFTFGLKSDKLEHKEVFVVGGFNHYQHAEDNQMEYDEDFGGYVATLQLKQGVYDYAFDVVENGTLLENYYDGNFSETENAYEVFVYHRPRSARADLLIGYSIIQANKLK